MHKTCCKCKQVKPLTDFYKLRVSKDGHQYLCKQCMLPYTLVYKKTPKGISTDKRSNYKRAYKKAMRASEKRGHKMLITEEQFNECRGGPCSYCGNLEYNGVDRIDNSITYQLDNIQSCCSVCNYMKMDRNHEDFLKQIEKIHDYQLKILIYGV